MSKKEFQEIFHSFIHRPGADKLMIWLEKSDFFTAPASTRFHGAKEGGLCEHSIAVYKQLDKFVPLYDVEASCETLAIVSLLHDLCKVGCYKTEMRNRKQDGAWVQVPFYTFQEDLPYGGHGAKSVFLIERFMKLTTEEAVAINCHMGFADRTQNDYSLGAAYEKYPLAWLLHVADEAATYLDKI